MAKRNNFESTILNVVKGETTFFKTIIGNAWFLAKKGEEL